MRLKRVSAATVAATLSALLLTASPLVAQDEQLDQGCERFPASDGSVAYWANYTQGHSFTPTERQITRFEVRVGAFDGWTGTLRGRLVLRPPVDAAGASAGGAIVLASSEGRFDQSPRFGLADQWVSFQLPDPIDVTQLPANGAYAIEVDWPIDPKASRGAHAGWAACRAEYAGGRAYVPYGVHQAGRLLEHTGVPVPLPATANPAAGLQHGRTTNLQFRVFGR